MRNTYHGLYRDSEHLIPSWRSCSGYETLGRSLSRSSASLVAGFENLLLCPTPKLTPPWPFVESWEPILQSCVILFSLQEKLIEGVPFLLLTVKMQRMEYGKRRTTTRWRCDAGEVQVRVGWEKMLCSNIQGRN